MTKILIIVTGCPGSGKSTFAAQLSRRYPQLTAVSYDGVKEEFFDRYGFDNAKEKDELNARSLQEFYCRLDRLMNGGTPLLIEYPFCRKHRPALEQLLLRHGYHGVTILLTGDMQVLYQRGMERDHAAGRHPGHLLNTYHKGMPLPPVLAAESMEFPQFLDQCREKDYNIALGETISVDVTDLQHPNYAPVFTRLDQLLSADRPLRGSEEQYAG